MSANHIEYVLIPYIGGKSAVLTAITLALGGKASLTGRGNGLKSFIREGQRYAVNIHRRLQLLSK